MRAGMPGLRADIAMLRLREGRLDAARCTQALEAVEAAALLAPHNPRRRLELGFALEAASSRPDFSAEQSGLRTRALAAYIDALAISARLSLDPLAQLSERERIEAERAIARLEADADGSMDQPRRAP
jgi:hypothetical protein